MRWIFSEDRSSIETTCMLALPLYSFIFWWFVGGFIVVGALVCMVPCIFMCIAARAGRVMR